MIGSPRTVTNLLESRSPSAHFAALPVFNPVLMLPMSMGTGLAGQPQKQQLSKGQDMLIKAKILAYFNCLKQLPNRSARQRSYLQAMYVLCTCLSDSKKEGGEGGLRRNLIIGFANLDNPATRGFKLTGNPPRISATKLPAGNPSLTATMGVSAE